MDPDVPKFAQAWDELDALFRDVIDELHDLAPTAEVVLNRAGPWVNGYYGACGELWRDHSFQTYADVSVDLECGRPHEESLRLGRDAQASPAPHVVWFSVAVGGIEIVEGPARELPPLSDPEHEAELRRYFDVMRDVIRDAMPLIRQTLAEHLLSPPKG